MPATLTISRKLLRNVMLGKLSDIKEEYKKFKYIKNIQNIKFAMPLKLFIMQLYYQKKTLLCKILKKPALKLFVHYPPEP